MQKLILPINDFKPTAGYKNAKYQSSWGYPHYGVDCVSATKKTPLYGLGEGKVIAAGLDGLNGKTTGVGSGCGYVLVIIYKEAYNHKTNKYQDVVVTYMHLEGKPKVKAGDKVTTETLLGHYGNTGANTTGAHLHIQIDTDTKYPLYCCGLSSKGHNILKKGTTDSTINPVDIFHRAENQTLKLGISEWYRAAEFKTIPLIEKPKIKKYKLTCTILEEGKVSQAKLALDKLGINSTVTTIEE